VVAALCSSDELRVHPLPDGRAAVTCRGR
jgi:hypothetical protein